MQRAKPGERISVYGTSLLNIVKALGFLGMQRAKPEDRIPILGTSVVNKVTIKVTAKGDNNHEALTKKVVVKIRVK